jgi:hypothetical protein
VQLDQSDLCGAWRIRNSVPLLPATISHSTYCLSRLASVVTRSASGGMPRTKGDGWLARWEKPSEPSASPLQQQQLQPGQLIHINDGQDGITATTPATTLLYCRKCGGNSSCWFSCPTSNISRSPPCGSEEKCPRSLRAMGEGQQWLQSRTTTGNPNKHCHFPGELQQRV